MLTESVDMDIESLLKELGFVKVKNKDLITFNIPDTGIFANFISDDDVDGGITIHETSSLKSKILNAFDVYHFAKKRRYIKQLIDHVKKERLSNTDEDFYAEKLNR